MDENQAQLPSQVIFHLLCFSEKDPMGFTLHFHFAKNEFFTNTILTKQVAQHMSPCLISSPNFTVRHEVSARPGWPLQLRRSRDFQVCGLRHRLAPWEELNCQTGAWTKDISYFFNFGAWWIVVKGLTVWVQLLQWDSLVINRKIYLNYLNLTTKWGLYLVTAFLPNASETLNS